MDMDHGQQNGNHPKSVHQELVLQLRLLQLGDHPGDFLRRAPEPPALEAVERHSSFSSLAALAAVTVAAKIC